MKNRTRLLTIAALALVAALAACSGSASNGANSADATNAAAGSPASDSSADGIEEINEYVAGEDNRFSSLKGEVTKAGPNPTYYAASTTLPGASDCAVYVYEKDNNYFGTCDFNSPTEAEARAAFSTWVNKILKSQPGWKALSFSKLPKGDILATMIQDPQNIHGVYVYVSAGPNGSYTVTTTFGTVAALHSS
jgi:hypothetical protein